MKSREAGKELRPGRQRQARRWDNKNVNNTMKIVRRGKLMIELKEKQNKRIGRGKQRKEETQKPWKSRKGENSWLNWKRNRVSEMEGWKEGKNERKRRTRRGPEIRCRSGESHLIRRGKWENGKCKHWFKENGSRGCRVHRENRGGDSPNFRLYNSAVRKAVEAGRGEHGGGTLRGKSWETAGG